MADIVAETDRLILRRERPGDLAIWLEHMNRPEVMAMVGGVQTPEKVAESFAKMAESVAEDDLPFVFVALKSDDALIGKCGLARIETAVAPEPLRDQVQIGWSLRIEHWRRGYATEAARAMLAIGFERFGLPVIYSQTSERNLGSWRVMQRLGMTRLEGLDYDDPDYPPEDNPTMVWGLTREAWQAAHAEFAAGA